MNNINYISKIQQRNTISSVNNFDNKSYGSPSITPLQIKTLQSELNNKLSTFDMSTIPIITSPRSESPFIDKYSINSTNIHNNELNKNIKGKINNNESVSEIKLSTSSDKYNDINNQTLNVVNTENLEEQNNNITSDTNLNK